MTAFHADVLGSLLRPEFLKRAMEDRDAGRIDQAEFKRIEDRAVDQAIAVQEGAGVDLVTDGEMRRFGFADQLWQAIEGIEPAPDQAPIPFYADGDGEDMTFASPMRVVGRISRRKMMTVEEFAYARAKARLPLKVTLPSPMLLFLLWSDEHSRAAYSDPFELFADATTLMHEEAQALAELGCQHIQIDAPDLGQLADPAQREDWEQRGISAERALTEGADMCNAIADVPGVSFSLHLCKGNYRSRWIGAGGYEQIAKQVFPRLGNFDRIMLEYDDARSGSFEPLAELPDDMVVVLGLISTKHDALETPEELDARIAEAARFHPHDQMAVSTQCGFASVAVGNEISEAAQERKLRAVAELAQRTWG
jgi:5-methyltetrahydropteroyltriglutamate--homocysteine methyltransferase